MKNSEEIREYVDALAREHNIRYVRTTFDDMA